MKQRIDLKHKLIKHGVKKLKVFGFSNVTEENLMTDEVYRLYFERILLSNLGTRAELDEKINELLNQMKSKTDFEK